MFIASCGRNSSTTNETTTDTKTTDTSSEEPDISIAGFATGGSQIIRNSLYNILSNEDGILANTSSKFVNSLVFSNFDYNSGESQSITISYL